MKLLHYASVVLNLVGHPDSMTGQASWFGAELRGRIMANGLPFNERKWVCASWFYPLGSVLIVTNKANGKSVKVSVSDRGPAWRLVFGKNRVIDLSHAAFAQIADTKLGVIEVTVQQIPAPQTEHNRPVL